MFRILIQNTDRSIQRSAQTRQRVAGDASRIAGNSKQIALIRFRSPEFRFRLQRCQIDDGGCRRTKGRGLPTSIRLDRPRSLRSTPKTARRYLWPLVCSSKPGRKPPALAQHVCACEPPVSKPATLSLVPSSRLPVHPSACLGLFFLQTRFVDFDSFPSVTLSNDVCRGIAILVSRTNQRLSQAGR